MKCRRSTPEGRGCRWVVVVTLLVGSAWLSAACGQAVGAAGDGAVGADGTDGGTVYFVDAGPIVTGEPQWAMLGATPQRNGRSRFVGPSQAVSHTVDLYIMEGGSPQVFVNAVGPDGTVYAVARDRNSMGRIVSLQPDGSRNWMSAPHAMGGVMLDSQGLLVFEGARVADPLDVTLPVDTIFGMGSDGSELWSGRTDGTGNVDVEHRHSAPLTDSLGNVYVVLPVEGAPMLSADGFHLCSFDASGAFRWCWDQVIASFIYTAPAMGPDENLYVAVENEQPDDPPGPDSLDGVYKLNLDGAVQWYLPLPAMVLTSLALADDSTVYYTGFGGGVFLGSVEPAGGKGWTATFPNNYQAISTSVAITPAAGPDPTIYVGAWHDPDADMSEGSITAFTPAGVERWRVETGGTPCGGMAVDATGAVYSLVMGSMTSGGMAKVIALESDGTERLSAEIDSPSPSGMGCLVVEVTAINMSLVLADGGRIYVGSADGKLHILAP